MAAAEAPDLVGQKIDDFDIVSRLGGGGMGVVYEGRDKSGDRFAIKTLKPVFANDKELVGRFLGEARALKAISHRAMPTIHSIGQLPDGTHYMVMEFLEGRSFEEVIEHGAPLDPREVLTWMTEVLDALEYVHAAGVIHRDLKPSNLFLARTGVGAQVKLIDFGIAKHTGSSGRDAPKTMVSAIVGTPDYMSPEQVYGLEVTAASDLYALGCVMFEMLTGHVPFEEDSSVRKMLMHVERPTPRASSVRPQVPKSIDDLVFLMMTKDPAERPKSARELKGKVQALLSDELGGQGPAPTMQIKAVRPEEAYQNVVTDPAVELPKTVRSPAATMPAVPVMDATALKAKRSHTEPVFPKRKGPQPPVWILAGGGALLLVLILASVWKLTHPAVSPVPISVPTNAETDPEQTVSSTEPEVAKPPPDRPVPKRKKPATPTRKKPSGKRR